MDTSTLEELAVEAFNCIEHNTGERLWEPVYDDPVQSVKNAADAFEQAITDNGLSWLIDATTGSGMSHMGLTFFLGKVKELA